MTHLVFSTHWKRQGQKLAKSRAFSSPLGLGYVTSSASVCIFILCQMSYIPQRFLMGFKGRVTLAVLPKKWGSFLWWQNTEKVQKDLQGTLTGDEGGAQIEILIGEGKYVCHRQPVLYFLQYDSCHLGPETPRWKIGMDKPINACIRQPEQIVVPSVRQLLQNRHYSGILMVNLMIYHGFSLDMVLHFSILSDQYIMFKW